MCSSSIIYSWQFKYWYITFFYDFIFKCVDLTKLHVTSLDTDSCYFALSSEPTERPFENIVTDKELYEKYYPLFFPTTGSIEDQKKLLGCMVEKEYDSMICLGPKCYSGIKGEKKVIDSVSKTNFVCVTKGKGVDMKKNSITFLSPFIPE